MGSNLVSNAHVHRTQKLASGQKSDPRLVCALDYSSCFTPVALLFTAVPTHLLWEVLSRTDVTV